MPDMNIKDYMLLGAYIFCLAVSAYAWEVKTHLEVKTAQFDSFKARTEAAADAQKLKNVKEIAERDALTKGLTEKNAKLQNDLDKRYADYRMHNSKAGSSPVPALSESAQAVIATDESRLAGTLERLETGILELAKSRDEAINQSNLCADWLTEQLKIVDTQDK